MEPQMWLGKSRSPFLLIATRQNSSRTSFLPMVTLKTVCPAGPKLTVDSRLPSWAFLPYGQRCWASTSQSPGHQDHDFPIERAMNGQNAKHMPMFKDKLQTWSSCSQMLTIPHVLQTDAPALCAGQWHHVNPTLARVSRGLSK